MGFLNYDFFVCWFCVTLYEGMHECTNIKNSYANTNGIVIVHIFLTIKHAHCIIITNLM